MSVPKRVLHVALLLVASILYGAGSQVLASASDGYSAVNNAFVSDQTYTPASNGVGLSSANTAPLGDNLISAALPAPRLSSPLDGAATMNSRPTFTWQAMEDASSYQIQVDDASNFASPLINATVAATRYTPTTNLTDGTYYWRVRMRQDHSGNIQWGPWTQGWSLVITHVSVDVPILMYHEVKDVPSPCNIWWITKKTFAAQMAALKAYGYTTVTLQDYLDYRSGTKTPPSRPIILTFDDGYQGMDTVVRPIFEALDFVGTLFLPTNYMTTGTRWTNRWDIPEGVGCLTDMLMWSDEAFRSPVFTFESHTLSHPWLTTVPTTQAQQEIAESKSVIENELGNDVRFFCYPHGDGAYDQTLWQYLKDAGYSAAVSVVNEIANTARSNTWALPRLMIGEWHSTTLNPARPDVLFMRTIDPTFAVPIIENVSMTIYDQSGRQRTKFQPGETVHFVVSARNRGETASVSVALRIDDDTDANTPADYDSHRSDPQSDVTITFVAGTTSTFDFYWTVPTTGAAGPYYYSLDFNDPHHVLFYKSVPWGYAFRVQASPSTLYEQRVNAGGAAYTDVSGDVWAADQPFTSGSWGYVGGQTYATSNDIENASDRPLYQTERVWSSSATPGYRFTVANGWYKVALKFVEVYQYSANRRRFDVRIEGRTMLSMYDIYADAGARYRAAPDKVFTVQVSDGELTIDFIRLAGYDAPKVNAIEVYALALGSTTTPTPTPTFVPSPTPTRTATPTPVATSVPMPTPTEVAAFSLPPYEQRVNVGGDDYTDSKGNVWAADQPFSPGDWGYVGGRTYSVRNKVTNTPDSELYQSERFWSDGARPGYRFTVPDGLYEVVLKFAENYQYAANVRRFDVRIEGRTVLSMYDIYAAAGGRYRAAPDRVFVVEVRDSELTIDFIRLAGYDAPKVNAIYVHALSMVPLPGPDGQAVPRPATK